MRSLLKKDVFTILLWLLGKKKSKLMHMTHTSGNSYLDKTLGQAVVLQAPHNNDPERMNW